MKKVTVQLVDDLDGSVIEEGTGRTVSLSLDGQSIELDLTTANARRLKEILDPYLSAGRPVSTGRSRSRRPGIPNRNPELQAIRGWAKENGIPVSDRGRIAATVRAAYAQAQA